MKLAIAHFTITIISVFMQITILFLEGLLLSLLLLPDNNKGLLAGYV